jgi:hypothetical protein
MFVAIPEETASDWEQRKLLVRKIIKNNLK